MKIISNVCRHVHGDKFAEECLENIKEKGYISTAQHYFGLHYRADIMPEKNSRFLEIIEEFGFDWFK